MNTFLEAIYSGDRLKAQQLLATDSSLARILFDNDKLYEGSIEHWLYVGDTAIHLAAAGYHVEIVGLLLGAGADPNSARNRRKSAPLHYAADGFITGPAWDAMRQVKTIECLVTGGADLSLRDGNGATALHRAVRTRCADAVQWLLDSGSNPEEKNKSGSTPFHLAVQSSGRGGTGTEEAKVAQERIIRSFLSFGVRTTLTDGNGKSIEESARTERIRELLSNHAA